MLGRERDQDLGIGVANHAAVAIGKADAAYRQADVIEDAAHFRGRNAGADRPFHRVCHARRFLNSGSSTPR